MSKLGITLAYITNRREPMLHWFLDSLEKQLIENQGLPAELVIVDFYRNIRTKLWVETVIQRFRNIMPVKWIFPMPSVWNGKHRLTKRNWFDAASSRETALCYCDTKYIAYVDDLSVLAPGWLTNARQSMQFEGITLGAYMKLKKMVVENGNLLDYDKEAKSIQRDSRWNFGSDGGSVPANGDMLYGCSLVAPLEAFLTVNGWGSAICGGLGFEDVATGQVMANAGFKFNYNRNLLTYESEEHHHGEPAFKRSAFEMHAHDKNDKGHAVLNMVKGGLREFPTHYPGGIRALRDLILSGAEFPAPTNPQHEWHTKTPLSEL